MSTWTLTAQGHVLRYLSHSMPRRALPYLATPRQASLYERICHGGRHLITSCKGYRPHVTDVTLADG